MKLAEGEAGSNEAGEGMNDDSKVWRKKKALRVEMRCGAYSGQSRSSTGGRPVGSPTYSG